MNSRTQKSDLYFASNHVFPSSWHFWTRQNLIGVLSILLLEGWQKNTVDQLVKHFLLINICVLEFIKSKSPSPHWLETRKPMKKDNTFSDAYTCDNEGVSNSVGGKIHFHLDFLTLCIMVINIKILFAYLHPYALSKY